MSLLNNQPMIRKILFQVAPHLPSVQSSTCQDADDLTAQPIGDARNPKGIRKATEINEVGVLVQLKSPIN